MNFDEIQLAMQDSYYEIEQRMTFYEYPSLKHITLSSTMI